MLILDGQTISFTSCFNKTQCSTTGNSGEVEQLAVIPHSGSMSHPQDSLRPLDLEITAQVRIRFMSPYETYILILPTSRDGPACIKDVKRLSGNPVSQRDGSGHNSRIYQNARHS